MDVEEALALLRGGREGIREWNRRRAEGEELPSLSEANLSGANLSGANLGQAESLGADAARDIEDGFRPDSPALVDKAGELPGLALDALVPILKDQVINSGFS